MAKTITVETIVKAPLSKVWEYWNNASHITHWAFASDDWEAPRATNDLQVGGQLVVTMAAKDKSESFDLTGTYSAIEEYKLIEWDMSDGRHVKVEFTETPEGVQIKETFDAETENTEELQRSGWQAILDNFKKHTEQ